LSRNFALTEDGPGLGHVVTCGMELVTRILAQHQAEEQQQPSQREYLVLCEELLLILREQPTKVKALARLLQHLKQLARCALDQLHALLSVPSFVTMVQELLHHHDLGVKRKALELLQARMAEQGHLVRRSESIAAAQECPAVVLHVPTLPIIAELSRAEQHLVMEVLPDLLDLCSSTRSGPADIAVQQNAWACIATLAECFGTPFAKVSPLPHVSCG
jgi:hypothetical protein